MTVTFGWILMGAMALVYPILLLLFVRMEKGLARGVPEKQDDLRRSTAA